MSDSQTSRLRSVSNVVLTIGPLAFAVLLHAALVHSQSAPISVQVLVQDLNGKPLQGVAVRTNDGDSLSDEARTSESGTAIVHCARTVACTFELSLEGYLRLRRQVDVGAVGEGLSFQLAPTQVLKDEQKVTIRADASSPLVETESAQTNIRVKPLELTPLRPATLIDTLPLVPGVSRTPDGRVIIEGSDESHSTLLINSVNVTDPATGSFGLSVPVDSVETIKVSMSPFLAQFGSFISGVVSAETRRGGEKWAFCLNDPLPEFRIRSGHLRGLRSATPRVNFSGPLVPNRLYFLEGAEFLLNEASVRTLPFPVNQTRSEAVNSFTQLDSLFSANQTVTASFHFAPHKLTYVNLNYFDPEPVTPNATYHEGTGTIMHRWAIGNSLLTSTVSETRVTANVVPQCTGEMTLTPLGNRGSYFGRESRAATRVQWLESWAPGQIEWHGKHALGVGSVLAQAKDEGSFAASTARVRDSSGRLLKTITFSSPGTFDLNDFELALYGQDHWVASQALALDLGLRVETQAITYTRRVSPRAGFTLIPSEASHVVIRGGAGVFYNEVPLNFYAFKTYPNQTITIYDGQGNVIDGPRTYLNQTDKELGSEFLLLAQREIGGNFAPYGIGWNIEGERAFSHETTLRVRYLHSDLRNQITLDPVTTRTSSAFVLGSKGRGLLRQIDLIAGLGHSESRQFFLSYVHQIARGDQTDALGYLADFPYPVVRSRIRASNPGEIPNRFLFWGTADLPRRMHIAPHLEWRNGFPFQSVDSLQDYEGAAPRKQSRFPIFFSADATLSKDLNVNPKHAVRFSLTGYNLTDHHNPLQVHNNLGDPQYGRFFGDYGRHLIVDFDFLF